MKHVLRAALLCLLIAGIVGCGGEEQTTSTPSEPSLPQEPGASEVGVPVDQMQEGIQQKVDRAKSDLRSLATGIECYYVDYNAYPENLFVLTTPIAYITRIMKDPFKPDAEYRYKKISNNDWLLWSVGPDGKDDKAGIIYNQNAGLTSEGDIIRKKM